MKYFNAMGVDVTLYVEKLVTENKKSKERINFLNNADIDDLTMENLDYIIEAEESDKQNRMLEICLSSLKKENIKLVAAVVELENKYLERIAFLEKEADTQELEPNGVVISI